MTDQYRLNASDISLIGKASALHDIGKIAIPDEILNKPGRLTKEEFEQNEWKKLLSDIGVPGEWEGVSRTIRYCEGDLPKAAKRKNSRVYWVE